MKERNRKDKNGALGRYGLIVFLMMLFAVSIIFKAGKIVFTSEGAKWREVGEKETVIRDRVILPQRGNIYTCDGKLLATTEQPLANGAKVSVMVRPQNMAAAAAAQGASERFSGQLLDTMITGSLTKLYLKAPALSSEPVVLSFPTSIAKHDHALGSSLEFGWSSSDAVAVPETA